MVIKRYEFRAGLVDENAKLDFTVNEALTEKLNTISVFKYRTELYLYVETKNEVSISEKKETINPSKIFPKLDEVLVNWPVNDGKKWIYMNPMFYHATPGDEIAWNRDRRAENIRGRIATLFDDEVAAYVYYHRALVDEGLLKGDKYHYISLNGNILFSYFEEPKTFVNLSGGEKESEVIKDYLEYGEETVFERRPGSELNFEFIDCVFHICNWGEKR